MPIEEPKNMVIEAKTAEKLKALGTMADSYDTVINRLIDFWEQNHAKP